MEKNDSIRSKKIQQTKTNKLVKSFNLGRIADKFFERLDEALEEGYVLARTFSNPSGRFTRHWNEIEAEREYYARKAEKWRLIYELKRRKLVQEQKVGEKLFYALTNKGEAEYARYRILKCDSMLSENKWCVVVFDIPESQHHTRNTFRKFLREAGFKYIQNSVWATQKDIIDSLVSFIKSTQVEHWVNVFLAEGVIIKQLKSKW